MQKTYLRVGVLFSTGAHFQSQCKRTHSLDTFGTYSEEGPTGRITFSCVDPSSKRGPSRCRKKSVSERALLSTGARFQCQCTSGHSLSGGGRYFRMDGQRKYRRPSQRGAPAKFGGAPAICRIMAVTSTIIRQIPFLCPSAETRGILGGQLLPLPILFRHRCTLSMFLGIQKRTPQRRLETPTLSRFSRAETPLRT